VGKVVTELDVVNSYNWFMDFSFPRRFVPWTFRSLDDSFHGPATL